MSESKSPYPAIPEPTPILANLTKSVRALKQVVEMLTGVRNTNSGVRAVTEREAEIVLKMPLRNPMFNFQALPPARDWKGCQVFCIDIASPKMLHSDGFNWCRPDGTTALGPSSLPSGGGGDGGGDGGGGGSGGE